MAETDLENYSFDSQSYCEVFNIVIFECLKGDTFRLLSPVPEDFISIYPEIKQEKKSINLQDKFPFIEHFLEDAQEAWSNVKPIKSDPWIETNKKGEEVALQASARYWQLKKLLIIEILGEVYDEQHNILQMGRETTIVKEYLEEEVQKRTQEIRDREEEIALRLVWAAEAKDGVDTGAHIRRIGLYSAEMASALGWDNEDIESIRIAATMHDVGKIAIPDAILKKPGKLTEEEFEVMKTHTNMGGRILGGSEAALLQMAKDIAYCHHEKWDGSGYPDGLSGEEIPISARIVSIVDVYDALVSKRVYKKAWTEDDAIETMHKERGERFDPDLFDTFLTLRPVFQMIANKKYPPLFEGFNNDHLG